MILYLIPIVIGGLSAIIIASYFIYKRRKPLPRIRYLAYKRWLVMRFDNDVASIANDIYQRMSPYQDEMCFDIVAEFTRDKYYTSATYIKTARGVIKQIKQYNRYAARTAAKENNSQRA